jgi:signal recognition particle receptor subunit alpha
LNFRAGAVEQLRTHVKRLNSLYPSQNPNEEKDVVELYEKGYGKDAAGIAMEAINHARASHRDVVLIDTAGRMQDNEPLMRSLSKLIGVNDPDLVLFVGEALVGNEAVDQLVKFNRALADHSDQETPHTIDGIVLTKFDTIDDKVIFKVVHVVLYVILGHYFGTLFWDDTTISWQTEKNKLFWTNRKFVYLLS